MPLDLNVLPDVTFVSKPFQTRNPFIFQMKLHHTKYLHLKKKKNSKDTAISMIKHNVKKYIKLHLYSELGHLILILALLFFFFPSYFLL